MVHKNPKVKVMALKSKATGQTIHALAHLSLMGGPQRQTGHIGNNTFGHRSVHKNVKVKVMAPRSKVTGPQFQALAYLPLMRGPLAQIGHIGINTLDAGASTTFPRSRS